MNCNEFEKIINEYIDGELSEGEKIKAEEHIASCDKCKEKVMLYKKLSEGVKLLDSERLPDDFKVELPKRNVVKLFFARHRSVVATLVAAAALVIFAGGINSNLYRVPESEKPQKTDGGAVISSAISSSGTNDVKKLEGENNISGTKKEETVKSTKNTQNSNKKVTSGNEAATVVEKSESREGEAMPSAQKSRSIAQDNTRTAEENLNNEAIVNDTAEKTESTEGLPSENAASGGGSSAPMVMSVNESAEISDADEKRNEISGYVIKSAEEFENEERYAEYLEKINDIKSRAQGCSDEEIADLYAEFINVVNQY